MTPFYSDEFVTIYHADFRTCAAELRRATVVVTDPPYEETDFEWDRWPADWPGWILRELPDVQSLWCWGSLRMFLDRAAEFSGWNFAQDLVWEKPNGSSLLNDRFRKVHEVAAQFYPRRRKWADVYKLPPRVTVEEARLRAPIRRSTTPAHFHGRRAECTYEYAGQRLARSVVFADAVRQGVEHGTPKPVPILRDLIAYSLPPGGMVADPMCGSGSTLLAAKELRCHAIGIEADLAACREAAARCSQSLML